MDLIPKELLLQIGEYLDFHDFNNFLKEVPFQLNNVDYISLIRDVYPIYYKPNINKYNVEYLYKSLLLLKDIDLYRKKNERPSYIDTELILLDNVISLLEKGYLEDKLKIVPKDKENAYELYKYLLLEIFTDDTSKYYTNPIYVHDDLDTFIKLIDTLDVQNFISAIHEGSLMILEYLLVNYNKINVNHVFESYSNENVSLETTKILFKYHNFDDSQVLSFILHYESCEHDSLDYLFEQLSLDIDPESLVDGIANKTSDDGYLDHYIFNRLWERYSSKLSDEQVDEIFKSVIEYNMYRGNSDNQRKNIARVSQHPAITRIYLNDK